LARLARLLQADTFTVLTCRAVPTNDACIALGHAFTAAARIAAGRWPDPSSAPFTGL